MLDGSNYAWMIADYIDRKSGRRVELVDRTYSAIGVMKDNPDRYKLFIAEPSISFNKKNKFLIKFRDCLETIREKVPVIVYSRHDLKTIQEEFELIENKHYDRYVSKGNNNSMDQVIKSIEELLK